MKIDPRSRARTVWLALAALLGVVACASSSAPRVVDFSEAHRSFRPDDYQKVFETWTRHAKTVVLSEGTVIELWATYKSWEYRQAYLERYAKAYGLTEAERTTLYNSQREAARQTFEFHVPVETTNYKWNDLDKETSAWRVSLVDGTGAEIAPRRIELLRLPLLYETVFFPTRTAFSQSYLIRFNRAEAERAGFLGPKSGRITLRIAGPLGKAETVWEAKSPSGS